MALMMTRREKLLLNGHSHNLDDSRMLDIDQAQVIKLQRPPGGNPNHDEQHDNYDENSEDETNTTKKLFKVTDRRRAQNAIFNSYVNSKAKDISKDIYKEELKHSKEEELTIAGILAKQQSPTTKDPREYQIELFERAKNENIVAVLDTGSGKTLIAVLLLKHILDQEMADRANGMVPRISFFLVPSVALVFQQHLVLECNLGYRTNRRYGNMGSDSFEKKAWNKHLEKDMVIVCTAEILHQCLIHSFVRMEQINLLIFDEAHHAKSNHPYAKIIRDFYVDTRDLPRRPRIFGMTASPVDAKVDIIDAARELEDLLQCKIATFRLSDEYRNQAEEIDLTYPRLLDPFETPLYRELQARFGGMDVFRKLFATAKAASSDIGSWGSDKFWDFALGDEEAKKTEMKVDREHYRARGEKSVEQLDADLALLRQAAATVANHQFKEPTIEGLSMKVRKLHGLLHRYFERPSDSRCIIFVTRRSTARLLYEIFQTLGGPYLRVGFLTGLTSRAGELNMSFREQIITMKKFRAAEVNCLFATSVAEEGLDIPDCNLVIRFDLYGTMIEYVQSKGRARHVNSKFIDLLEEGNLLHRQISRDVRDANNEMRSWCERLPADRLLGDSWEPTNDLEGRTFTHPASGAKLTYSASLCVLDMFTSSLSFHDNQMQPKPLYVPSVEGGKYLYEVILPENSPIRSVRGRPYRRKGVAKRSSAFEMCIALLKAKYIDPNLMSTFKKKLPAFRNAQLALHEKKGNKYPIRMKPALWQEGRDTMPSELYLTVLDVSCGLDRSYQPLALVTRMRLPEFPQFHLFLESGRISTVLTKTLSKPLYVDNDTVDQFTIFTHRLWKDVNNKIFELDSTKMAYWVVPLLVQHKIFTIEEPEPLVDWAAIDIVFNNEEFKWTPEMPTDFLVGKFVIDRDSGGGRFFFKEIAKHLTPLSPVPENSPKPWGPGGKTRKDILDYSNSLFASSRAHQRSTWKLDQPVFEAEMLHLHQNMLAEAATKKASGGDVKNRTVYLCPEPLQISALPPTVVAMWEVFPAIIHRLEDYLITLEACELVDVKIDAALALEAFTKDSDNSGDHNEETNCFLSGMGNNYERLEFIGDCFLKMATSISLFGQNPNDNEFDFHVKRMLMICNKNLFETATNEKLKLPEYIRSLAFHRATWYPDGLHMIKGKGAEKRKDQEYAAHLGDKTVADICEALIGAAFIHNNRPGKVWTAEMWDPAVRAVTKFVNSEDHTMQSWADYLNAYEAPAYQIAEVTAAQKDLARQIEMKHQYHFRYPRLLRSAFCHPSHPYSWEMIPSYQRLEFLGDSLLDTACVTHLFYRYPEKDPQWLTEHKMAMVANKFLGALCVKLGFHRHLRAHHSQLMFQVQEYVTEIEDAMQSAGGAVDYWIGVKDPPKCLPDIIEAYVGAIFVDSGFDYNEVQRFFDEHMKPYFEDMSIYDTFANNHPTTHLYNKLITNFGCSNFRLMSKELIMEAPGIKPKVMSALILHETVACDAFAASSRYAKLAASKRALDLLHGLAVFEYREKFGCDCKPPAVGEEVKLADMGTAA